MKSVPKLVKTWDELAECISETHVLDIDIHGCSGWIRGKDDDIHYLSTHTFYGSTYEYSTKLLQSCGFNVQLANWDE
jgi:hypothetical protein